jgi:hypothetical protein
MRARSFSFRVSRLSLYRLCLCVSALNMGPRSKKITMRVAKKSESCRGSEDDHSSHFEGVNMNISKR